MKRSILIYGILLSVFSCNLSRDDIRKALGEKTDAQRRQEETRTIQAAGILVGWQILDYSVNCFNASDNPAYTAGPQFFGTFNSEFRQFQNIVIGDSTMAFSDAFPGFIDHSRTYNYAVPGNTLCDMVRQWPAIHQNGPSFILVSTAGGNDLLRSVGDSDVIRNGTALADKIRAKWPGSFQCWIGVHPTLVAYANAHKAATNAAIKAHVLSLGFSAWVDPLPVFGVAEGSPANPTSLLPGDAVHYNATTAGNLKSAAQASCGFTF